MAISPVEIISMAPKSQEVSIMKQADIQKPTVEQLQIAAKLQTDIKHNNEQTIPTNKSMNPEYRYDAKEKSKNSYEAKIKRKKKNKSKEKKNNTSSFGGIDIRI